MVAVKDKEHSGMEWCVDKKVRTSTRLSVTLFLIALLTGTNPAIAASDPYGVSALEERIGRLDTQARDIAGRSGKLLQALETSITADVESNRQSLIDDVERWNRDIDSAAVQELNFSVNEALVIAGENGLPVDKLRKLFELTKKIIREGEFIVPDFQPPDKDTFRMHKSSSGDDSALTSLAPGVAGGIKLFTFDYEAYFNTLYTYAQSAEDAIAVERAQQQEFRVKLYKRATLAFIKALLASEEPPGDCVNGRRGRPLTLLVNGQEIVSPGCPDPVIDYLRDYLSAIHKIQSADADVLGARADMVIAGQQLAADLMAGVPVVGEFLDAYAVYAGENIAGLKLSDTERTLTGVMLIMPLVGPSALEALQQGVKRLPDFKVDVTVIHDSLAYLLKRGGETSLGKAAREGSEILGSMGRAGKEAAAEGMRASFEAYQATVKAIARDWDTTVEALDDLLVTLGTRPDKGTRFLNQALEDAARGRKLIADLPYEARLAARLRSQEIAEQTVRRFRLDRSASGVVDEHMDAMVRLAREHDEIFIVRPVNSRGTAWIEQGYSTKPMTVKAKSASHHPFAGLIPVDPKLNKTGSKLANARAALENTTDAVQRVRIAADIEELEKALVKAEAVINKCKASNCAKQVHFLLDGLEGNQKVYQVFSSTDKSAFAVFENGKWFDADALQAGKRVEIGFVPQKKNPVMLLADENGVPFTADYDFLNFAQNKPHQMPGYNEATGYISKDLNERIPEINKATREASEKARGVSTKPVTHHGAEQLNPYTPGVDYPLTVIDGRSGEVFVLPACTAECMSEWCQATKRCDPMNICGNKLIEGCVRVDPNRLLKDYYHDSRLAGYTLDPNPNWGWGEYNGLSGWTHPEVYGPAGSYSLPVYSSTRSGERAAGRGLLRMQDDAGQQSHD